jgi:tetratricopeptide (TPR) repeat protein
VAATARATLLTARGETYLAAADLGRAEVALRTALAACPHLIPARYQLAVVLEKRGRELEARAILEAVAGKVRYYPGLTERLARLLQKAGDLKGAEATFERGLAEIRPSAAFRLAAAQFFFDIGRQARTRQILEALIVEGHGSADVYYLLGKAYAALGLWDNAAREFRRALFAEARPEFHLALARVHEQTRRGDEALVQYKQALDLRPDYDEARLARARLLTRRGARGEALRDLDILARHGEAGAAVYLLMGSCLADLRRLTRAIAAYETASRLDPRLGEPHYRLGQIYSGLERPAAAAAELSRAIALGDEKAPWYADALLLLGFAYRADHQRVLAIQAFRRYLAVAPSMAEGRSQAERELAFLTGGTE